MTQTTKTILLSVLVSLAVIFTAANWLEWGGNAQTTSAAKENVYDRVMRTKTLKCGYFLEPPFTLKDPNTGALSGIIVDLTHAMATDMGLKVEWAEEINAVTMIEGLNTNRYDALCASIWNLTIRSDKMEHSQSYLYTPIAAFARIDDMRFDSGLEALSSPDVTLLGIEGSGETLLMKKIYPGAKTNWLPQFSNFADLFVNLAAGKGDVAFATLPMFKGYEAENPGKVKNITVAKPFFVLANSFTFKKGELEMKSMFDNAVLNYISSGELDRIVDKWEKYPGSFYRVAKPYQFPAP